MLCWWEALPPNDEELARQLCLPGYHIRTGGSKLVIESKQDIQARGEKSPDDADALALTFARPVAPVVPKKLRPVQPPRLPGAYAPFG